MTKGGKTTRSSKRPKTAKSTTAGPGGGKAPSRPSVALWLAPPGGQDSQVQGLFFQFDQHQWWEGARLLACQMRQLQSLIDHAAKTVPYYRDSLGHLAGLGPGELTMDALRKLPILRRTDIQDAGDALVTNALPTGHDSMFDVSTSGSTGRPLVVKGTKVTSIFFQALGLRYHAWHRRDLSLRNITIEAMEAGEDFQRLKGWASGAKTGLGLHFNHALPASRLLDMVVDADPDYLQVHPSTLREMLVNSLDKGKKPRHLREARTVSEALDPDLRQMCERVWGIPAVDNYSAQEFGIIALQCPEHPHLHVQSENVLAEVLDENDSPCGPGKMGRLVITALNNFASPLIRYENGDYAEVGPPCPCGRGLPVLAHIAGRVRNLAILPNGDRVTPILATGSPILDLPVRQYQYVQKSLEEIEVRLVVGRPLTGDEEARITDFLALSLRHPFACRFVYVDEIPRLASGKYEVFRCEVAG